MGTSTSYGGQKDRTPLLPAWALPPDPSAPEETEDTDEDELPPTESDASEDVIADHPAAPQLIPPSQPKYQPLTGKAVWSGASRSLGNATESNRSFRNAAKGYVKARGGSSAATTGATGGRSATSRFAGFLSDVARQGFKSAFERLGFGSLVGRDLDSVIATLANALCPAGSDLEDVAAREAGSETLQEIFMEIVASGGDTTLLDSMNAESITKAVETMAASYIYNRWLADLGIRIEEKAISPTQAVQTERRMKEFVRDAVKLDMSGIDVLTFDWAGGDGRAFMERIYRDAYSIIGGGS